MANRLYNEDSIRDIASAIREKNGTANTYSVAEMGQAIRGIQTESGGITPTGTIQINTNGTHDVTQYASAYVSVPVGITPSGEIEITESGRFDVTNFASAFVNIATGGGSGDSGLPSNIKMGTFTVVENHKATSPVTVSHNIDAVPIGLVVVVDEIATIAGNNTKATIGSVLFGENMRHFISNGTKLTYSANGGISDVTSSTFTFTACADAYPVLAGVTYRWFAWT